MGDTGLTKIGGMLPIESTSTVVGHRESIANSLVYLEYAWCFLDAGEEPYRIGCQVDKEVAGPDRSDLGSTYRV